MKTAFFFYARLIFAWAVAFAGVLILWSSLSRNSPPWLLVFTGLVALVVMIASGAAHMHRVRLVAGTVDAGTLANRQRRQIEIPFEAGIAFEIVDATIRELPRSEKIESARDSLQVRAKVQRISPYGNILPFQQKIDERIGTRYNQVFATVTPRESASSVILVCEPEGGAWSDWFLVDDGTNLENAEAITRAITRRIAERRRGEQASVTETVTEKELAVAKLGLLQAQVEPHFLYNTLGSAKYLIKSDPVRAEAMLDNLILYLRNSLPRTDDSLSTLGEELARVRAYLEILQIRMGERLKTQIDVADALKSIPFPSMMLQTLVENAIKHGLEPKSGGGTIWIIARAAAEIAGGGGDAGVAVTVADDGRGFGSGTSGTGIGLKNVKERLALAYGTAASFTIVANFPSGVAATITVPAAPAAASLPPAGTTTETKEAHRG